MPDPRRIPARHAGGFVLRKAFQIVVIASYLILNRKDRRA